MKHAAKHKRKAWCVTPGTCPLKSSAAAIREVQIVHNDLIARFAAGAATGDDLQDLMETWLTYTNMMDLYSQEGTVFTDEAGAVMQALGEMFPVLHARHVSASCILLTEQEVDTAKSAAGVMDELIAMDRNGIALRAAMASSAQLRQMGKGASAS